MTEKKSWMEVITTLDRRIVYLLVALAVVIPLLLGAVMPVNITPSVRGVFDYVDQLPEGSKIMVVLDYDPSSEPELYPMTLAIFRHCFDKHLKILAWTMWPNGAALTERAFDKVETEYPEIRPGVDFVNFGYQVGGAIVILQAGQDMLSTFPTDYNGASTSAMPIMTGVKTYEDISYVIDLAAGSSIDWWVAYGVQRYHFTLGAGCTAVSATQYYPYLNTGQINGLVGGLKGASEYEMLAGHLDRAAAGMVAQSSVHALIILMVALSNVAYFISKKKGQR